MTENNFDWVNLDSDEELLWSGEPRIQSIIPALVIGLPMSLVLIGIPIIVGAYLNIKNTDFVVTNQGLYKKTGVLSKNVKKIGFDKVQNISFSQSALGNYFGYGNVEISTAGGSGVEMRFQSIESPQKVQELINKRIHDGETAGENKLSEREILMKMYQELDAIRKAVEDMDQKL